MKKFLKKGFQIFFLTFTTIIFLTPIWLTICSSFMGKQELSYRYSEIFSSNGNIHLVLFPEFFSLFQWVNLLFSDVDFYISFFRTIFLVILVLIFQSIVAIPAAWVISQSNLRMKKFLWSLYVCVMFFPFILLMVPQYIIFNQFHLIDTLLSLLLPATFSAFPVFLLYNYFNEIPPSILDSAKIDGANEWLLLLKIGIPMCKNGIYVMWILNFFEIWNALEQPLIFITKPESTVLAQYIHLINSQHLEKIFTTSTLSLIFPMIIYLLSEKLMIKGIAKMFREGEY